MHFEPISIDLFLAYAKQPMQINKFLCIIISLSMYFTRKQLIKDTIFVSENL
jgi:hypothetical protein